MNLIHNTYSNCNSGGSAILEQLLPRTYEVQVAEQPWVAKLRPSPEAGNDVELSGVDSCALALRRPMTWRLDVWGTCEQHGVAHEGDLGRGEWPTAYPVWAQRSLCHEHVRLFSAQALC